MKNRVIILGANGFIGSHLVKKLLDENFEVIAVSRSDNAIEKYSRVNLQIFKKDFNEIDEILNIIQKDDIIFDLISSSVPYTSMIDPYFELQNELHNHISFYELAFKKDVKKIIFTSSGGGLYGKYLENPASESNLLDPVSPHAINKAMLEFYLKYFAEKYQKKYLIYRISNPYGPGQIAKPGFGVIASFFEAIKEKSSPTIYDNGDITRDFIYIDDLITAMSISFNQNNQYSLYNLGSQQGTTIKDIWLKIKQISESSLEANYFEKRYIDSKYIVLNTQRFSNEYLWQAKTSIEEGLRKTWAFLNL